MKEKLNGSHGFAKNGAWLENGDIVYITPILKRNITLITAIPNADNYVQKDKFSAKNSEVLFTGAGFTPAHPERWVIYNSGGHFQPLIKK